MGLNNPSRSAAARDPDRAQVDLTMGGDGRVRVITWYKRHAFAGHYSDDQFHAAEADGTLSWDAIGNPIIRDMTPVPDESEVTP